MVSDEAALKNSENITAKNTDSPGIATGDSAELRFENHTPMMQQYI